MDEQEAQRAFLEKLPTIQFGRRGFIKVATGAAAAAAVGPFILPGRTLAQAQKPVVVIYGVPWDTLDPHNHIATWMESIQGNMFEQPVEMSSPIDPVNGWRPLLATSWKRLNPLTMQFKLREGVKFHNGEDFDAEAVKFGIDRIHGRVHKEFKGAVLSYYEIIDRAEPVDKYTVNVITKRPDPILVNRMGGFHTRIVPPRYYAMNSPAHVATNPVGSGPYRFVSWVKDGDLVMEANDKYWGGAPEIKKIIFRTAPEASVRVSALLAGDADLVHAVPPEEIDFINRSGKAYVSHTASNRVTQWRIERHKPPMNNQKVRQAVNYGANMDGLLKTVYGGMGKRVSTMVGSWHFGYDDKIPFYPHDPAKARQLLKESGLALPIEVNFHTVQGRYPKDKDMAEGMAAELAKLGRDYIRTKVNLYEWGTHLKRLNACENDGIIHGSWGNWMFDAEMTLTPWLYTTNPIATGPACRQGKPEWDKLLDEGRTTLDMDKRKRIYSELQRLIWDDPPFIFGHHVADIMGVNNRLVWKVRQDEMVWLKEARFKK
jgi:peptide/nickel transport system substrate-binding protein